MLITVGVEVKLCVNKIHWEWSNKGLTVIATQRQRRQSLENFSIGRFNAFALIRHHCTLSSVPVGGSVRQQTNTVDILMVNILFAARLDGQRAGGALMCACLAVTI